MEIFQAANPGIVKTLMPFFIVEDGCTQEQAAHDLCRRMMNSPAHTCVIVSFDEDRNLRGFITGWDVVGYKHCWISQAWMNHEDRNDSKQCLKLFEDWCVNKRGKNEIRMQTKRNEDAFQRAYDFKYHRTIMSKEIQI